MSVNLKKIEDQVIVITGASSGIGLATAKLAAERGAKVVLCARHINELEEICRDIESNGGREIAVECDVSIPTDVEQVAARASAEFGGFDTWVNNAGYSIYGKAWQVPLEEKHRLFDVNFWGVVHGCRSALKLLKNRGGAIINIGSVLSERAIPIQGIYVASKHAVKGYTDSLRMEIEAEKLPVSVSLIKPGAIDTPYPEHAINHMEHQPVHTPPVYAPEVVARAILECAVTPKRDVYVGGSAKLYTALESLMPRILDLIMEKTMTEDKQSNPKLDKDQVKHNQVGEVRGNYPGHVAKSSAFTFASMNPGTALLLATGFGLATALGLSYWQSQRGVKSGKDQLPYFDIYRETVTITH
jgi:short-subunit dehydrogenase